MNAFDQQPPDCDDPDEEEDFVAYCPWCLCTLQPLWRHTQPTNWSHGYGLQFVSKGGEFIHLNVPIDGGSFIGPLLKMVRV